MTHLSYSQRSSRLAFSTDKMRVRRLGITEFGEGATWVVCSRRWLCGLPSRVDLKKEAIDYFVLRIHEWTLIPLLSLILKDDFKELVWNKLSKKMTNKFLVRQNGQFDEQPVVVFKDVLKELVWNNWVKKMRCNFQVFYCTNFDNQAKERSPKNVGNRKNQV